MRTYVLYHAGCPDGFGAAWAAHEALGDDAEYVPVLHDQPPPEMDVSSTVYLVDFCYPRDVMRLLSIDNDRVVVLDHHKTALAALLEEPGGDTYEGDADLSNTTATFDMNRSGATITWTHFFPTARVPRLLRYVEDRDLWRRTLPYNREVSAFLNAMPMDFETWSAFARDFEDGDDAHIIREGAAILRAQDEVVRAAVERSRWAVLGGQRVPIVNATVHGSDTGEALCRKFSDAPFAAYYFDTADGRRGWGLRSRNGFDVSEVAKRYGGGGHQAAAGFTTGLDFYGEEP